MKTVKNIGFIITLLCAFAACRETALEDFTPVETSAVQVSAGTTIKNVTKTNESLTVTVGLTLSGHASKAFEVGLRVNQDTVLKQLEAGTLKDVSAVSAAAVQIDNVAKVSYGSDVAEFRIAITRTEVERHFGKKIAIGYSLNDASKENNIDEKNSVGIVILNTAELLTVEDIHYLSFQTGGDIVTARDRQNYNSSSGGISIPLTVNLASFPGNAFSIDIVTDLDTVQRMVTAGTLPPNTVALPEDRFTVDDKLSFRSNASQATFAVDVPWSTINENEGKLLAVVVRLRNPSLHIVDPAKSFTTILIDCDNVLEEDVTNLGVFSVNRDNGGGPDAAEGSKKMVDNNFTSKFLQPDFTGDLVCMLVFPEPQKIGAYTLTSGNDAQQRDPNEWELQASNDGVNWTTIDSRRNETFANRLMTRRFNIAYPVAYTHYRLNITSIVGGTNLFQITEWRMIKVR
jgi:hypothetical protein